MKLELREKIGKSFTHKLPDCCKENCLRFKKMGDSVVIAKRLEWSNLDSRVRCDRPESFTTSLKKGDKVLPEKTILLNLSWIYNVITKFWNRTKRIFSNSFTSLNLLFGFFIDNLYGQQNYDLASMVNWRRSYIWCLGWRSSANYKIKQSIGVELDSLSDVVSFGVAPAFLIYELGLQRLGTPELFLPEYSCYAEHQISKIQHSVSWFKKEILLVFQSNASINLARNFVLVLEKTIISPLLTICIQYVSTYTGNFDGE